MWTVNYLHEKYRKANPDEIKSFEKQSKEFDKVYNDTVSYHMTEIDAIIALRKYHVDCSLKHLKRESELSKRIKELTTE